MHQAWFADDSSVGGKLSCLRRSWDELERIGPGYGYLPNAKKTVLIVKKQFLEHRRGQGKIWKYRSHYHNRRAEAPGRCSAFRPIASREQRYLHAISDE